MKESKHALDFKMKKLRRVSRLSGSKPLWLDYGLSVSTGVFMLPSSDPARPSTFTFDWSENQTDGNRHSAASVRMN